MKTKRIKFKTYQQNQVMLFPPSFDELIPADHPVRIVNQIVDEINISSLIKKYKSDGCTSYHPKMLLKVIIYSYLNNLYSSRKIEAALKENVNFMWLSGMSKPDHNTINRFRSERLKGIIKDVFTQIVLLLVESGHIDLQNVFTDGTKIEANANRYTVVWGKNVKRHKEKLIQQLEELWNYAESVAADELKNTAPAKFEKINPEEVQKTIDNIDKALRDKDVDKQVKKKVKEAKRNMSKRLANYNKQEEYLGNRNSFSKTDTDATFMRMKEDRLGQGELKAAYNVQISTTNQIIVNYSIHQNSADTTTLKEHIKSFKKQYGFCPKELTADAGYGSEENYEFLKEESIVPYVKYNHFDREKQLKEKAKPPFHTDNLHYNEEQNCYYCPMGQRMNFVGVSYEKTENGYERKMHKYQAQNCTGCPIRGVCCKTKNNKIIEVSHRLRELKAWVKELLLSEKGKERLKKRPIDVEPVFGMLKQNKGFKRFMLRQLANVNIELGLLAIAHNIQKVA